MESLRFNISFPADFADDADSSWISSALICLISGTFLSRCNQNADFKNRSLFLYNEEILQKKDALKNYYTNGQSNPRRNSFFP